MEEGEERRTGEGTVVGKDTPLRIRRASCWGGGGEKNRWPPTPPPFPFIGEATLRVSKDVWGEGVVWAAMEGTRNPDAIPMVSPLPVTGNACCHPSRPGSKWGDEDGKKADRVVLSAVVVMVGGTTTGGEEGEGVGVRWAALSVSAVIELGEGVAGV